MCNLIEPVLKSRSRVVYKVAIKINGRYYSPAMGHEYKVGDVPTLVEQFRLTNYFINDILHDNFIELMKGRTARFIKCRDAISFKNIINNYLTQGKPVVLRLRLSKELLEGSYYVADDNIVETNYKPVIAGKHIDSIKELSKY